MGNLNSTFQVSAVDVVIITAVAWALFTCGLFVHRWLGKAVGHPIGVSPSVKTIP